MHLKFDAVAVSYRKAMRDQGLAKRPVRPPMRAGGFEQPTSRL
jgi:hypothetical protein